MTVFEAAIDNLVTEGRVYKKTINGKPAVQLTAAQKEVNLLRAALKSARLDLYAQRGYRINLGHPTEPVDQAIYDIDKALSETSNQ